MGLDGDHILVAHQAERRKVFNLRRDDRVALSMLGGGKDERGLETYLVVHGRATVTPGGAPDLLRPLARSTWVLDVVFPPGDNPPEGFITRVSVERVVGIGPGAPIRSQSTSLQHLRTVHLAEWVADQFKTLAIWAGEV